MDRIFIDGEWVRPVWQVRAAVTNPSTQDVVAEIALGSRQDVVTEAGTIKARIAVFAGGARESSFCRQLGIRFPQATVRQSIVRVSGVAEHLPDALHTARVSITRRSDGSYNLAISGRRRGDPTAQLVRFAPQFLALLIGIDTFSECSNRGIVRTGIWTSGALPCGKRRRTTQLSTEARLPIYPRCLSSCQISLGKRQPWARSPSSMAPT